MQGPRLFFNPVGEIKTLNGKRHSPGARELAEGSSPIEGPRGRSFRILTTIDPGNAEGGILFGFNDVWRFGETAYAHIKTVLL